MTQEELEFNKRCAFFLQWKNKGMVNLEMWVSHRTPNGANTNELLFHSDWNWIHEVIEKINNSKITAPMNDIQDSIIPYLNVKRPICRGLLDNDKKTVIQAINKFLIWYNEQNK